MDASPPVVCNDSLSSPISSNPCSIFASPPFSSCVRYMAQLSIVHLFLFFTLVLLVMSSHTILLFPLLLPVSPCHSSWLASTAKSLTFLHHLYIAMRVNGRRSWQAVAVYITDSLVQHREELTLPHCCDINVIRVDDSVIVLK